MRHHGAVRLADDDARDPRQKPRRPVHGVAGVLGLEALERADQHHAQLRRKLPSWRAAPFHRLGQPGRRVAQLQVVAAEGAVVRRLPIALAEGLPGPVGRQHHISVVEHTHMHR